MKPYGVPRFIDTEGPDKADIKRYGFSAPDRCSKKDRGKNEARRIWKRKARIANQQAIADSVATNVEIGG